MSEEATGFEAGFTGDDQIKIALQAIADHGGTASMAQIYEALSKRMVPVQLSAQGRASLRFFVNKVAVQAGYVAKHDKSDPGWRMTPQGREYLGSESLPAEQVLNVETEKVEQSASNSARGAAFELYLLALLKSLYPHYSWFHQGERKSTERGLDFVGTRIGEFTNGPSTIGVQVKFHRANMAPSQLEWLKFLAGCHARRVDLTILVTSGRLTSEQRREAGEAKMVVIEGREEITRIARLHQLEAFELFEENSDQDSGEDAE
jgi:hypothetical protein